MPNDPIQFTQTVSGASGGGDFEPEGRKIFFTNPFSRYVLHGLTPENVENINTINLYSASGLSLNYTDSTTDAKDTFTFVDQNGEFDENGSYIYYNDALRTNMNGTGQLYIIIQD